MRIKLDENLPTVLVGDLGDLGHDVDHVHDEGLTGKSDSDVWTAAQREQRFLITQDVRFADIRIFGRGLHSGLMLVRLKRPGIQSLSARVRTIFGSEDSSSWPGCFLVLTDSRLRIRRPR